MPVESQLVDMQITQYLHTAILVSDLEKSETFYGEVLKLPKVERSLKFPGVWYQLGNIQLHLIVQDGYTHTLQNVEKWGRNPHLALAVDDLEMAKERLTTYGCEMQLSASGRAAIFTRDPDGNVIELSEVKGNA